MAAIFFLLTFLVLGTIAVGAVVFMVSLGFKAGEEVVADQKEMAVAPTLRDAALVIDHGIFAVQPSGRPRAKKSGPDGAVSDESLVAFLEEHLRRETQLVDRFLELPTPEMLYTAH